MGSTGNKLAALVVTTFVGATASVAHAMVFDGGQFSSDKVTTHTDLGSDGPEPMPTNLAYDLDRYSNAPVGIPLYILGTDDKCYRGNFSYSKYEKVLIVYSKSPVSSQFCIYQRDHSSDAAGFAISARDGGVCIPALAGVANNGGGVEEKGGAVAFSSCIAGTMSYGDYTAMKAGHVESVAMVTQPVTPVVDGAGLSGSQAGTQAQAAALPGWVTSANEVGTADTASTDETNVLTAPPIEIRRAVAGRHVQSMMKKSGPAVSKPLIKSAYTFQISSHTTADEAETKIKSLKALGLEAFMTTGTVGGVTWYRVCIGHFDSFKDAQSAREDMVKKTGLKEIFIQKVKAEESAAADAQ